MPLLTRYETTAGAREDVLDRQNYVQTKEAPVSFRTILRDKATLERMYAESSSMKELASKIGCGETAVHKWLHRHGILIKPRIMCQKGVKKSESHKKSLALWATKRTGELNPNWKGGKSKLGLALRSKGYKWRRQSVLDRDNHECQSCGIDMNLHVHHILPVKDYPDLVNDLSNCMTLCGKCHRAIHFPKLNQANSVKPNGTGNAELNS